MKCLTFLVCRPGRRKYKASPGDWNVRLFFAVLDIGWESVLRRFLWRFRFRRGWSQIRWRRLQGDQQQEGSRRRLVGHGPWGSSSNPLWLQGALGLLLWAFRQFVLLLSRNNLTHSWYFPQTNDQHSIKVAIKYSRSVCFAPHCHYILSDFWTSNKAMIMNGLQFYDTEYYLHVTVSFPLQFRSTFSGI